MGTVVPGGAEPGPHDRLGSYDALLGKHGVGNTGADGVLSWQVMAFAEASIASPGEMPSVDGIVR